MGKRRYPKIFIRSKRELARHISDKHFTPEKALSLINDSLDNFNFYWKDSRSSKPEKQKFVRAAVGTPLGVLLDKISQKVLSTHDNLVPFFIFGGIKGKSHVMAAKELIGSKRKRTLLKIDIKGFYEKIDSERVERFFWGKCGCSKKIARIFGRLCCVPIGAKNGGAEGKTIARGFSTSPRLAVWCNLDFFIKLEWLVKKRLKGKNPRIAIYVDDIGITASNASKKEMALLYKEIEILSSLDNNQKLPLHPLGKKSKIMCHDKGLEILGVGLRRNKLDIGFKTKSKIDSIKSRMKKSVGSEDFNKLKQRKKGLYRYADYVRNF
jgi:hypothetical protein